MSQDVQNDRTPQSAGPQSETTGTGEPAGLRRRRGRPIEVIAGSTGTTNDPSGTVARPPGDGPPPPTA